MTLTMVRRSIHEDFVTGQSIELSHVWFKLVRVKGTDEEFLAIEADLDLPRRVALVDGERGGGEAEA